jgi:putative NADPH-quinone reductase
MNVLIVDAHPEPRSFNGALKDIASRTMTQLGHEGSGQRSLRHALVTRTRCI